MYQYIDYNNYLYLIKSDKLIHMYFILCEMNICKLIWDKLICDEFKYYINFTFTIYKY